MSCINVLQFTFLWLTLYHGDVQSHSWISCTDYIEKNDDVYEVAKCRGWPRAANTRLRKNRPFAQDTGFDKKPTEYSPCQAERNDDKHYDSDHPMAIYYPGQQVVLAHPMKNHGADSQCTNIHIPDNGNYLHRGSVNGKKDPTLSQFRRKLVFDLGRSKTGAANTDSSRYPKPGFQNSPAFCNKELASTDNALGTYSFNVPRNLPKGRYTFIWLWAFNSDRDLYSTCFEVEIASNKQERDVMLRKNGFSDLREPCGGATSNPEIQGNCNEKEENNCPTCGTTTIGRNLTLFVTIFVFFIIKSI